jgi:hypothetical protein
VSNELAGSVLPAQAQAYRLQGALVDQETGVRGYAITGDSRFLQPYTAGLATENDAEARLHALIGGQQPLAADLNTHLAAAAARDSARLSRFRSLQDWVYAAILVASWSLRPFSRSCCTTRWPGRSAACARRPGT